MTAFRTSTLRLLDKTRCITTTAMAHSSDVTKRPAGVGGGGWSTGAMFVDYDRDGQLDLFVSRYLTWDFSKDIFSLLIHQLLEN